MFQDAPFVMPIASRNAITGRGTVVIGTVEAGTLKKGDKLEVRFSRRHEKELDF